MKCLIAILIFCIDLVALAHEEKCQVRLSELHRSPANSFHEETVVYTPEQRKELDALWESNQSEEQKLKATTNLYRNARLAMLSKSERDFVIEVLGNSYSKEKTAPVLEVGDSHFSWTKRSIRIHVIGPAGPETDFIRGIVLAHEMEHAIQVARLLQRTHSDGSLRHEEDNLFRFLEEKSAMLAELTFIQSVPRAKQYLQKLVDDPKADSRDEVTQSLMKSFSMATESSSPREYLQKQWENARYSLTELRYSSAITREKYLLDEVTKSKLLSPKKRYQALKILKRTVETNLGMAEKKLRALENTMSKKKPAVRQLESTKEEVKIWKDLLGYIDEEIVTLPTEFTKPKQLQD